MLHQFNIKEDGVLHHHHLTNFMQVPQYVFGKVLVVWSLSLPLMRVASFFSVCSCSSFTQTYGISLIEDGEEPIYIRYP